MSEDSFAYKAAEAAYKADDEYPFSPSGLLDACRAYHKVMLRESDYSHWGYDAFLASLQAKHPEEWERGYRAGYSGEPHKMNNISDPAYQAGWLCGNAARMAIALEDDGVKSTVILATPGHTFKKAVIVDARARSARHCDL